MSKSVKSLLKVTLGVAAGCVVASAAGTALLTAAAAKRMKKNEEHNNMLHSSALCKKSVVINPDIEYAYINQVGGSATVTLSELPTHDDMNIELESVCAVYNFKLPADVIVKVEGTGKNTVVNNTYSCSEDESLPIVHIDISRTTCSCVNIH